MDIVSTYPDDCRRQIRSNSMAFPFEFPEARPRFPILSHGAPSKLILELMIMQENWLQKSTHCTLLVKKIIPIPSALVEFLRPGFVLQRASNLKSPETNQNNEFAKTAAL